MNTMIEPVDLRLGLWEERIGVYFHHRHLPMLEKLGIGICGGCGFILNWDGFLRCLRLEVDFCGTHVRVSSEPDVWPFRLTLEEPIPTARCEITSLKFDVHKDALTCIIPPDHELPWPRLRECEMFDKGEVAQREITRRLASQREHGVAVSLAGIPKEFQMAITAEERVKIAKEAGYAPAKEASA